MFMGEEDTYFFPVKEGPEPLLKESVRRLIFLIQNQHGKNPSPPLLGKTHPYVPFEINSGT